MESALVFDTETWLIQPGRLAPKLVCMSSIKDDGPVQLHAREDSISYIRLRLAEGAYFIGQTIAFDFGVLCQEDPFILPYVFRAYDEGRVWDVGVFETLLCIANDWMSFDPRTRKPPDFSLAGMVKARFNEGVEGKKGEDIWRLRYHELDGVPLHDWPPEAVRYAKNDATLTARVWKSQLEDAGYALAIPDLAPKCASAWSLHLMSAWGLRTDAVAVADFEAELRAHVDGAVAKLKQEGIYKQDGKKSMSAIRDRVKAAFEGNPPTTKPSKTYPEGQIATDSDTLEQSGDSVLAMLADISTDSTNLNTYIPVLKSGTEKPLNTRFYLVATGRTSSRKPNVQNQPRKGKARECYVPRPGYVYVGADYHIAELCALAQVLLDLFGPGSSRMAEALQAGRELHLETAAGILGCPYEEAVARYKAGDKEAKDARQLAKAANFGYPGGLGAEKFVTFARQTFGLEITIQAARDLKDAWLARYPEMRRYFALTGQLCEAGGGRFQLVQHRSNRVRGGVGFCDGCNSRFQGLVADGARAALYEVAKECYTDRESPLWGSRPVLFVHDEIIMETPWGREQGAAKRLEEIMIREMQRFIPDIPIHADAALMTRWYKDAEPVRDAAGRLIPWRPKES